MVLKLAHISDLHFSPGVSSGGRHLHSVPHLMGIEALLAREAPNWLVASGDITNNGDVESLLRAKGWLFDKVPLEGNKETGLRFRPECTVLIPGNHDAWNGSVSGDIHVRWQRSLENYQLVFGDGFADGRFEFTDPYHCDYDWIEADDFDIYIARVDSSFIGEGKDAEGVVPSFDRIACGNISIEQSQRLLDWVDRGLKGRLPKRRKGTDEIIDRDRFRKSLKILVMHHYIFDPFGSTRDPLMDIKNGEIVFRNLMMADFDLILCGHKHKACVQEHVYGDYLDERSRRRCLLNIFRQFVGLHAEPLATAGRKVPWMLLFFTRLAARHRPKGFDPNEAIEALRKAISNPDSLHANVRAIFGTGLAQAEILDKHELTDIRRALDNISKAERLVLAQKAAIYINECLNHLEKKPLVQIMSGSSAKAGESKQRSVNLYTIRRNNAQIDVELRRFDWRETSGADVAGGEFVLRETTVKPFRDDRHGH
ncbi:metallophosphoesterase family protein [Archangium lansingense]|uniref:metallophosphoesterase family protein n=1 Tax=Archangium lansingense TaxID=2995310 RepID=UPI003B7C527C